MVYDPRQDPKYKNNKLLLALTHQESRFNPNAVSPTGARGLTQVLPSTARSPGFGIAPNTAALTDPEANMAFGASYLGAMQKRYKGDNAAALVAYNGGPGKADEWVASGKNDKVLSKETSNYYKSVLGKAGEGYDFSKVKASLPKSVASSDDDSDEDTTASIGFAKLKQPGSKSIATKPSEDSDADEAEDKETEKTAPKVKKTKASKEEDDDDDDEEDGKKGKSGSTGFDFDAESAVPKLKEFTAPETPKLSRIALGNNSLLGDEQGLLQLPPRDNPRTR